MKTIDRLKEFIDAKNISYNAFDTSIGAGNGYIGRTIKNKGSIGSDIIEKIYSTYPEIDIQWLITGIKKGNTPTENQDTNNETDQKGEITPIVKEESASDFASPTASPTEKRNKKTIELTPQTSPVTSGNSVTYNLGAPKIVTVSEGGDENVLYVPVKVRAGYLLGYGDPEYMVKLTSYRLPGLNNGSYRMFEVDGPSMAPGIVSGDRVIGQWVANLQDIRDNRVYVVVTRTGIVVKRLLNRLKERGKLYLRSDTITHRHEFPTVELDPADVLEVWYCRMKLSGDFSEPGEVYHRLADLEGEMVAQRSQIAEILTHLKAVEK